MKKIASYLIVLAIGAMIGTYFDAKHTIEEKVVYKDRIRTVTREVITERPDGTKVTERVVDKNEKSEKQVAKRESIPTKKDWGVSVKTDLFVPAPVYTAEIHRRIFADFYISAYGRTDGTIGAGVSFFF